MPQDVRKSVLFFLTDAVFGGGNFVRNFAQCVSDAMRAMLRDI